MQICDHISELLLDGLCIFCDVREEKKVGGLLKPIMGSRKETLEAFPVGLYHVMDKWIEKAEERERGKGKKSISGQVFFVCFFRKGDK